MLIHPQFDPVAFSIGPISVRWYGLMYLAGFALFWLLGRRRAAEPWRGITSEHVENMLFWGVIGVIAGARLGYCLFYQPAYYMADPVRILEVWHGGMSAHGGMIGVIAVMIGYAAYYKLSFWTVSDFVAPLVPLGLFCGRIGNFINGELWGRPAPESLPWAMVFPQAGDGVPRHPSELYEAGAEGPAALRAPLDRLEEAPPRGLRERPLPRRLRPGALRVRMVPRARFIPRAAGARPLARAVADAAGAPARHRHHGLVRLAREKARVSGLLL
jgi:phosphatidylglycerol---prolipoprotein diacylglyceryl transferase